MVFWGSQVALIPADRLMTQLSFMTVCFSGLNVDDDHVTRKQLVNKALTHLHIADE